MYMNMSGEQDRNGSGVMIANFVTTHLFFIKVEYIARDVGGENLRHYNTNPQ